MEPPARKWLSLAAEREALRRMEDAARTEEQFEKVIEQWNHIDENRERRERDHEVGRPLPLLEWGSTPGNTIIPKPYGHEFWRELLHGDFLCVIFDCPYEIHEQTGSKMISCLLENLNENQKEVLYLHAIRLYSFQRIAAIRGQTDRNILKVYTNLIKGLRKKLYGQLALRYDKKLPLTMTQKQFVEDYRAGNLKTGKPAKENDKKKRRS